MRSKVTLAALTALAACAMAAQGVRAEDRYGPARTDVDFQAPTATLSWPGKAAAAAPSTPTDASDPVPAASALPTSIYAPPPPVADAAAQPMLAGLDGQPPRFYSVAREYGAQPDPINLSPQFAANTQGDLADPPPPTPHAYASQTANMSAAVAASRARAAADAAQSGDLVGDSAGDPSNSN